MKKTTPKAPVTPLPKQEVVAYRVVNLVDRVLLGQVKTYEEMIDLINHHIKKGVPTTAIVVWSIDKQEVSIDYWHAVELINK